MNEIRLGSRTLQPWRQLLAGEQREPLGKRALQILSVLADAKGAIVTKDELFEAVWPGVTVEDNALRVHIVALRKALGDDADRLKTIRAIGYRLDLDHSNTPPADDGLITADLDDGVPSTQAGPSPVGWLNRRNAAAGLIGVGVLGAIGLWAFPRPPGPASSDVQPLLDQAWQAWTQGTAEGNSQAIGLYRRATERAPDHADAWGLLGCAYADRAQVWVSAAEQPALRRQSRQAGQRALRLDPSNAIGRVALAYARPLRGNWAPLEGALRRAMQERPDNPFPTYGLAWLFTNVGRLSEAADLFGRLRGGAPAATQYFFHVTSLWGAGRIEEAERLLHEADIVYASHPMIWRLHFDMLVYAGQLRQALAMAEEAAARSSGASQQWLNRRAAVVRTLVSRSRTEMRAVTDDLVQEAREAAGLTGRAVLDLTVLGRLDEAFSMAEAFYFSRGFAIPDAQNTAGAAPVTLNARGTGVLFFPQLEAMRADSRFDGLVRDLGLVQYWQQAKASPDFRRA